MLNESLFLSSFDELKNLLLQEMTIFHIALAYVLVYVLYKSLGRYIYFKPQEHASKINRTFLTLSLLVVLLHALSGIMEYLPLLPEYRWLYMMSGLILLIAPLSILMDWVIWRYDRFGSKSSRGWHYYYLPISKDYNKTSISKDETRGPYTQSWEEEAVESTIKNIHSDALLNMLALVTFITVAGSWAYESMVTYGWLSSVFFVSITLAIGGIFLDRGVFSWMNYLQKIKWPKWHSTD